MLAHRTTVLLTAALLAFAVVQSIAGFRDADAHAPHPGVNFSMGVDIDGDTVADCGTEPGEQTVCTAALNAAFRSREYLLSLGDVPAYRGLQLHFGFLGGVAPATDPDALWPGCAFESFYYGAARGGDIDFGHAGCQIDGSSPSIAYTGLVGQIFFRCTADGSVDQMHGDFPAHTEVNEIGTTRHAEGDQTFDYINITCAQPAPYPTDSDGDRCPDSKEATSNPLLGGSRNFFDEWDYFNPTGDGSNRIDDILMVIQQYFIDQGDVGYTTATDRTAFGPNNWNLGPPNGQQRLDDILATVASYFHDCG